MKIKEYLAKFSDDCTSSNWRTAILHLVFA